MQEKSVYHEIIFISFFSFKHHVETHHPKEILSLDDFLKLRKEIVNKSTSPTEDDDQGLDDGPPMFIGPPGLEVPPGMEDTEGGKVTWYNFLYY